MFLKAGALSLALLLASRLLGLLRESAQAATFGSSGQADLVVLMLTLPDWLAGVTVSGALAYVLLPGWAGQGRAAIDGSQMRVGQVLAGAGFGLGVLLVLLAQPVVELLAPGAAQVSAGRNLQAVALSACALPAAMIAGLWATRLQHERDFTGLYGANLVVNGALILGFLGVGGWIGVEQGLAGLGVSLLAGMLLRLAWLRWRMLGAVGAQRALQPQSPEVPDDEPPGTAPQVAGTTAWNVWLWAVLLAGLPLALPVVARAFASGAGAGALTNFNYAWKLVELPLMLAVQLVATLAFPSVTQALARGDDVAAGRAMRQALALAWVLACAACAALLLAAPALAGLLFGWGRMTGPALADVARWGATAAWGLLPQALIAVCLTALAGRPGLWRVVAAYGLGLLALAVAGVLGSGGGASMMQSLNAVLAAVAVVAWLALGRRAWTWLPWRAFASSAAALLVLAGIAGAGLLPGNGAAGVGVAVLAALSVLAVATASSPDLRDALRR